MSRVEPEPQKRSTERRDYAPKKPEDRHPSQAEGDEATVNEALQNEALRNDQRERT